MLSSWTILLVLLIIIIIITSTIFSSATPTKPTVQQVKDWPLFYLTATNPDDVSTFEIVSAKEYYDHQTSSTTSILATSHYKDALYKTGWYFLTVNTSTKYFREQQQQNVKSSSSSPSYLANEYFASGFLEGYLTYNETESYQGASTAWESNVGPPAPQNYSDWMYNHVNFMRTQVELLNETDPWWGMVGNLFQQLEGLAQGFSKRAKEFGKKGATFHDMFAVNWAEGNGVYIHLLGPNYDSNFMQERPEEFLKEISNKMKTKSFENNNNNNNNNLPFDRRNPKGIRYPGSSHCSALVRVTDDDLYTSQAAWQAIFMLTKMQKTYEFSNGRWVSMSSWPGAISSLDDFYSCNHLTSVETSLSVYNYTLYKYFPYTVVSEFLRVMVANWMATNGPEWSAAFSRLNSGTYNNLYIVTTYDLVKKEHLPVSSFSSSSSSTTKPPTLPNNTVWLVEQIPHHVISGDVTYFVNKHGFFPGFNSPFFAETRRISGWDQETSEYGDFFSFYKYARYKIFSRDAPKIQDLAGMQKIMRYNDFKNDPASRITNCSGTKPVDGVCSPPYSSSLAIACRGDLMKANLGPDQLGPLYKDLGQGMTAETDAKISRWSTYKTKETVVIAGPAESEEHGIPAFNFLTSPWANMIGPEKGLPDIINNSWQLLNFSGVVSGDENNNTNNGNNTNGKNQKNLDRAIAITFIVLSCVAVVLLIGYYFHAQRKRNDAGIDKSGLLNSQFDDDDIGFGTTTASTNSRGAHHNNQYGATSNNNNV